MARDVVRYELRDPSFEKLEQRMDELVSRLLRRPSQAIYQRAWAPRVDVYETPDEYIAIAELAAVYSGDVSIEISGEEVAITGERAHVDHPEDAICLQLEIPYGGFERRLVLPSAVDPVRSTASFEDGLLTVRLPKIKQGPTRVQVEIKDHE
jgi:HSP20 family protein